MTAELVQTAEQARFERIQAERAAGTYIESTYQVFRKIARNSTITKGSGSKKQRRNFGTWIGIGLPLRSADTRRNQACYCGSGRKFKHCCADTKREAIT